MGPAPRCWLRRGTSDVKKAGWRDDEDDERIDMIWESLPAGTRENYGRQRENIKRMFVGGDHDVVPIGPLVGAYAATDHGRSMYEYYTEPEKAIAWQLDTARVYGILPYLNWNYSVYWNEDYGGTIRMPTGLMAAPAILTYPADTVEKADKLEPLSPEELLKGPTMARHVRGVKAVEAYSGKGYKPWQFIYEPFAIASFWVSPENLLMWVIQEPDLAHSIMRKVVTHCINACEALSQLYPGKPFKTSCATLLANSSTMSVDQCKEFATGYMKDALEKIIKIGAGTTGIFYHQCGDHADDYHLCADMPFPPGSVMHVAYDGPKPFDLLKAAKVYENKCCMMGNTDTILAYTGTPEQVYDMAYKDAMRYKRFKNGFIASMACECPPMMSSANFQAFVQGSRDGGKMKE